MKIDIFGSYLQSQAALSEKVREPQPLATRIRHTAEYYQLSETDAAKFVREHDHARRRYVRRYFNAEIDDPTLYDVTLNTGRLGFDRAAEGIALLALQHHNTNRLLTLGTTSL